MKRTFFVVPALAVMALLPAKAEMFGVGFPAVRPKNLNARRLRRLRFFGQRDKLKADRSKEA